MHGYVRYKELAMIIDKDIKETMHEVVGACYDVYKELHGGLLEKAYEDCLCYELRLRKHDPQQQVDVPLWYKGVKIGRSYKLDLLVDNRIILELKAVEELAPEHRMQLFNYMRLTKITYGMLINFSKDHGVKFERYYLDLNTNNCMIF